MNARSRSAGLVAAFAPLTLLLGACSVDEPATATAATSSTSSTTRPSATAPPTSVTSSPSGFTPISTEGAGTLAGGKVGMTANGGPGTPWAVFDVPRGWESLGGWYIGDGDQIAISYWTIDGVFEDPCDQSDGATRISPDQTVEGIVRALGKQRSSRVTRPEPITVDGHRGVSLEVRTPDDLDVAACPHYRLWDFSTAGERYLQEPGGETLYVLDVDGKVVVLSVPALGDLPRSDAATITRMIRAVRFVPRS